MAFPNAKAPVGQGGRFAAMKQKVAHQPGVTNPGGLAAFIGRQKYDAAKMQSMAQHGADTCPTCGQPVPHGVPNKGK